VIVTIYSAGSSVTGKMNPSDGTGASLLKYAASL